MLTALVTANLLASVAHFAHNAVYLESYPGPDWIPGPWFVVCYWLVAAAVLVSGYAEYRRCRSKAGLAGMGAYCLSSQLVFGHYLYGAPRDYDLLTNSLIVLEGVFGMALLIFIVGLARRRPAAERL